MGAYDIGGGGGHSDIITDPDQTTFDQPFEISGQWNASTAQQLNDMLSTLFKSLRRNEDAIQVLEDAPAVTGSGLLVSTLDLSNAQLATLSSSPVTHIDGVAGSIIVPVWWTLEWETTVGYTSAPNWRLRPDAGTAVDIFTETTSRLNEVRHVTAHQPITVGGYIYNTADDLVGAGVKIHFSADPTGAGTSTARSIVGYQLIEAQY